MSTHIETIEGLVESDELNEDKVETTMSLCRFWGGEQKGRMLQLTVMNPDGYIQLTQEEAVELARILLNSFNDEIYPSE